MHSNIARGLAFALLPTLLLSAPAIGDESSPKEVLVNATSSATATPPANLNVEPTQPAQPAQPVDSVGTPAATELAPVVAEQPPTPALLISTKVPTTSRVTPPLLPVLSTL